MRVFFLLLIVNSLSSCAQQENMGESFSSRINNESPVGKVEKTDKEWKEQLTFMQYNVLRKKWTEPPGTGTYNKTKTEKDFLCVGCFLPLFSGKTKYDSGSGWPSFYQPITSNNVLSVKDADGRRVEVLCGRCYGHLGHVFKDGPRPTGLRYCINSAALLLDED